LVRFSSELNFSVHRRQRFSHRDSVQSTDGTDAVYLSIFDNNSVNVGATVNGVWQGWTRVGTAPTISHAGGPEILWHTYQIRLDSDGTFSALFDGNVLRSGISAGPASAWNGGIGTGTLFTQSNLDDRHLSTSFDNVQALGLTAAPHTLAGTGGDAAFSPVWNAYISATSSNNTPAATNVNETPSATAIPAAVSANVGLTNGTNYFHQVTAGAGRIDAGPVASALAGKARSGKIVYMVSGSNIDLNNLGTVWSEVVS
jgi:hypothetical protein